MRNVEVVTVTATKPVVAQSAVQSSDVHDNCVKRPADSYVQTTELCGRRLLCRSAAWDTARKSAKNHIHESQIGSSARHVADIQPDDERERYYTVPSLTQAD